MAQKKNPDALELLRATGHEVIGLAATAAHVLAGLPMGYNRDTRELKEWSALGFDKTLAAVGILRATLATLGVNQERMAAAVRANYSATTDLADAMAQRTGVGYRQIYAVVGKLVDGLIERGRAPEQPQRRDHRRGGGAGGAGDHAQRRGDRGARSTRRGRWPSGGTSAARPPPRWPACWPPPGDARGVASLGGGRPRAHRRRPRRDERGDRGARSGARGRARLGAPIKKHGKGQLVKKR